MTTRKELVEALRVRYGSGAFGERIKILDEFVALTGYHRKHAVRALREEVTKTGAASALRSGSSSKAGWSTGRNLGKPAADIRAAPAVRVGIALVGSRGRHGRRPAVGRVPGRRLGRPADGRLAAARDRQRSEGTGGSAADRRGRRAGPVLGVARARPGPRGHRKSGAFLLGKASDAAERAPALSGDLPFDSREGIAATTFYDQIKAFFTRCAGVLRGQGDGQGAERFEKASTHWMRHSYASHAIVGGMPIEIAQQNLGHASPATTTIYVTTEKRRRMKAVEAFWGR